MQIEKLQINNFGKLKNKEIKFNDGINIIVGENESGKSTLLKFITGMLYGISKNKNGKSISDYDRFLPWDSGEYSGKITYKLDNDEEYEVYRNFAKKNPEVFDKLGNDISKNYTIDKTYGNRFFSEQTKVDEELFCMTMAMLQKEVELDSKKQNNLIQKVSNIILTGEDDVSYKKIMDKLTKRQSDDIGTEKSPTKPLYQLQKRLEDLQVKQKEMKEISKKHYETDGEKERLTKEVEEEEIKLEIMQELQELQNDIQIEEGTIKINIQEKEKLISQKQEQQEILKNMKHDTKEKQSFKKLYILPLLLSIIIIILFVLNKNSIAKIFGIIDIISLGIVILININSHKKYKELYNSENEKISNIKGKIEIIENEIQEKDKIIVEKKKQIDMKNNFRKEQIRNKYSSVKNIVELLKKDVNSSNVIDKQKYINDLKLDISKIDMQRKEDMEKLENMASIDEEILNIKEELKELLKYNDAINLAKETIEDAYMKIKEDVTPKFTTNLSEAIKSISNGKYNTVKVNEENCLMVETQNRKLCSGRDAKCRNNR